MPDWKKLVRQQLAARGLTDSLEEVVIAELAAHLEDACADECRQGRSESEARKQALDQVPWNKLAHRIQAAKHEEGTMNQRTRALWLPAMANMALAVGLIIILDRLNLDEPGIATAGHIVKAFRLPWLLALPISGAVGALLSKRAQASRAERLIAGLAPSLAWLAVFFVIGLAFVCDRRDFAGFPMDDLALSVVGLVILPALALLLGTLPFLRESRPPEASRHAG
jgi:hypothetical protein